MKTREELEEAMALLAESFTDAGLRRFVWGSHAHAAARAWGAFQLLGWALGSDESGFAQTLAYVEAKLEQHAQQNEEATRV